jgi:hypothetical protein
MPHPAHNPGVGQKEEEGGASRSGQAWTGSSGRPDPLLPGESPPPLGAPSSLRAGGHAGVSRGERGCRKTPPQRWKREIS